MFKFSLTVRDKYHILNLRSDSTGQSLLVSLLPRKMTEQYSSWLKRSVLKTERAARPRWFESFLLRHFLLVQRYVKYRGDKSQADMAKQYKVSQQAWSSWENGDKKPDVATMKQIERDSGIPMETLFFDVFNKR